MDAGAGTGILGMLAARAGCASVVGVELSAAMCDAAERTIARNGLAARRAAPRRLPHAPRSLLAARSSLRRAHYNEPTNISPRFPSRC